MNTLLYKQISDTVRIIFVYNGHHDDLVVQVFADGKWNDVKSFSEMSDDYAYTNSVGFAKKLVKDYLK